MVANIAAGNVGGAVVDLVGVVIDTGATAVPFVPGGATTLINARRAARAAQVARNRIAGAAFEKGILSTLRLEGKKAKIISFHQTANFRVPDALLDAIDTGTIPVLFDAKNVKALSMDRQMRDFLSFADSVGGKVVIAVNMNTKIPKTFRQAVESGLLTIVRVETK